MIGRWQLLAATLVIIAAIELSLYFFFYLPNRSASPGPSQWQDITVPVEDTAPTTVSKTSPPQRSTPPPSKTQYRP